MMHRLCEQHQVGHIYPSTQAKRGNKLEVRLWLMAERTFRGRGQHIESQQVLCGFARPSTECLYWRLLLASTVSLSSGSAMKPSTLQEASASGRSTAPRHTGSLQSVTASILPFTRAAVEIDATIDRTSDASIGINTCGWYKGVHLQTAGLAPVRLMSVE